MMTRGRGGSGYPPENDDVIYEQPLISKESKKYLWHWLQRIVTFFSADRVWIEYAKERAGKSNFRLRGFCIFDATDDSQFESGAKMCENATSSQHLLFTAQTAELISYWGFEIIGHIFVNIDNFIIFQNNFVPKIYYDILYENVYV